MRKCKIHNHKMRPNTKGRLICGKCTSESFMRARKRVKYKAIMYKGGKCEDCGYNNIKILQFHHRDPLTKKFTVGAMRYRTWEVMKKEIDKCDLLCPNCHAERHEDEDKFDDIKRRTIKRKKSKNY